MSHDLYDRLLEYTEIQRRQAKLDLDHEADKSYYQGRLTAFLDLIAYLMTDGRLT